LRLFVAILLDDEVRTALGRVQQTLDRRCDGVRWVRTDQLHVTVKFLGDVDDRDVSAVTEAIAAGAADGAETTMTVSGAGCFPPRGGVRIVWAGASDEGGALARAAEAINGRLEALGFEAERRRWSPHITIGRVKFDKSAGRVRSAVEQASYPSLMQPVDSVSLMSSVLSPKGPTYDTVFTCPLGTA